MKNSLYINIIYVLICVFLGACSTAPFDKESSQKQEISIPTQKENTNNNNLNKSTSTLIEHSKKIKNITTQAEDYKEEILILKSKINYLEKELNTKGETTSIFDSPFSMFNQQIVLDNGTIYYGNVIYQDEQIVTIETLIGKLNLDRSRIIRVISHQATDDKPAFPEVAFEEDVDFIEDGNILFKSPAEIILLGNIAISNDEQGNAVLSGKVKNIGGKRADFVKINMTLYRDWSSTKPPKVFTVFVDGSTHSFDEEKTSRASVEPKAIANFSLIVPSSFGTVLSWKYNIDFEEY